MIAASVPEQRASKPMLAECRDARSLAVPVAGRRRSQAARGRSARTAAALAPRRCGPLFQRRRSRDRERCRDACPPASPDDTFEPGAESKSGWPGRDVARPRPCHALRRRALRPRRLPHAHGGPAAAAGLAPGDRLALGPLAATIARRLRDHPRLVELEFDGRSGAIWEGLARHGRPIQYAHVAQPLVLWDTWTPIAGPPVAFEPPSAGFVLDWRALASMRARALASRRSRTRRASRRPAIRSSTRCCHSTSRTESPSARRASYRARARGGQTRRRDRDDGRPGARARGGPRRDRSPRRRTGHTEDRAARPASASSTRFSREPTSRGRATTSCCAPLPTMRRSGASTRSSKAHAYRTHEFGDSVFIEGMRCRSAARSA